MTYQHHIMVVVAAIAAIVIGGCMNSARTSPSASESAAVSNGDAVTQDLRTVSVDDFARVVAEDGVTVLDVRTPQEYAQGRIAPDARNVDYYAADFRSTLSALPRDGKYAIYCRSGNRSSRTLAMMRELGFRDVVELRGGVNAWTAAGRPLVEDK